MSRPLRGNRTLTTSLLHVPGVSGCSYMICVQANVRCFYVLKQSRVGGSLFVRPERRSTTSLRAFPDAPRRPLRRFVDASVQRKHCSIEVKKGEGGEQGKVTLIGGRGDVLHNGKRLRKQEQVRAGPLPCPTSRWLVDAVGRTVREAWMMATTCEAVGLLSFS